jgi:large subunit ribosomal protein L23
MGLLKKWFDKKEEDQLAAVEKSEPEALVRVKKGEAKSTKGSAEPKSASVKKSKTEPAKKSAVRLKGGNPNIFKILVKPVVSEKAAKMEGHGVYVFMVDNRVNKYQVAGAVKELYGVAAEKVRMINSEGKKTRFGRQEGKRKNWKKAIVTLPKGQTINIHEGV